MGVINQSRWRVRVRLPRPPETESFAKNMDETKSMPLNITVSTITKFIEICLLPLTGNVLHLRHELPLFVTIIKHTWSTGQQYRPPWRHIWPPSSQFARRPWARAPSRPAGSKGTSWWVPAKHRRTTGRRRRRWPSYSGGWTSAGYVPLRLEVGSVVIIKAELKWIEVIHLTGVGLESQYLVTRFQIESLPQNFSSWLETLKTRLDWSLCPKNSTRVKTSYDWSPQKWRKQYYGGTEQWHIGGGKSYDLYHARQTPLFLAA